MRTKALNRQSLLETLCLFLFAGLLFYVTASGQYLTYVTPRMFPYLLFTGAVLLLWAFAGLPRVFTPQHRIRAAHNLVLLVPALLLLLPHSALTSSNLTGKFSGGSAFIKSSQQTSAASKLPAAVSTASDGAAPQETLPKLELPAAVTSAETTPLGTEASVSSLTEAPVIPLNPGGLTGIDEENRRIVIDNASFYTWISEIYVNMEHYVGYTVRMTGYVYYDTQYMNTNEFVPARLVMTCCAADLTPAGIICTYEGASSLTPESWVTVEGVLKAGDYLGNPEPQVTVTSITPAEAVEGYIYP